MRTRVILGFFLALFVSVSGPVGAWGASVEDVMKDAAKTKPAIGAKLEVWAPLVLSGTTGTDVRHVCVSGDMMYRNVADGKPAKAMGKVPEGKQFGLYLVDVWPKGMGQLHEYRPVDLPACSTMVGQSGDAKAKVE